MSGRALTTLCALSQDMKLRYYSLVISLALEEDAFLDACKSYQEVYDTPEIKADEAKSQEVRRTRNVRCRLRR